MAFLYGEISRKEKSILAAHLNECSQCRGEVERWQKTMHALDEGKTVTFHPHITQQPWLKWGVAAAILLFIGFGVGRFASGAAEQKFRTSLKSELREELLTELKQEQDMHLENFVLETEKNRASDSKAVLTTLGKMQAAHDAEMVWLREHLETVALNTQNSLQYEQQQIVSLANNNPSSGVNH